MADHPTDPARLLADELAIRNALARLAHLADSGDLDEYLTWFTPDASWELPDGPRRGHADILAGAEERRATGTAGPGSNTRHIITTIDVRVDGSDTAQSSSYYLFVADTTGEPHVAVVGAYDDTWVRGPEGWKLDRRVITYG